MTISRLPQIRKVAAVIAGLAAVAALFSFRLGSLTGGRAAAPEAAAYLAAGSWHGILADPLNAPFTVLVRFLIWSGYSSLTSVRAVSVVWGLVAVTLIYHIVRSWHNRRVAILTTCLFVCSAAVLHVVRLAAPDILWLVAMAVLVAVYTVPQRRASKWLVAGVLAAMAALLYIPGMVWLVLAAGLVGRRHLLQLWRIAGHYARALGILASLVLIAPLGRAMIYDHGLLRPWAGISDHFDAWRLLVNHFLGVPEHLFVRGGADPVYWLAHLPALSVFELVIFGIGGYFYVTHWRSARTRLLLVMGVVSWLLIGFGNLVGEALLLPLVYLVAATGIAFLLHQWLSTFPRNPLARGFGIAMVTVAVLLACVYQTRVYFVAWRYNPATVQAFSRQL